MHRPQDPGMTAEARYGGGVARKTVPYVAELDHVRDVSLYGSADLEFWTKHLDREGLLPCAAEEGRAKAVILAVDARWKGIPFRELSVSVFAKWRDHEGVWLAQAYNSSRFLAFCERRFFRTPYAHGHLVVQARTPAALQLRRRGREVLVARMGARGAEPSRNVEESLELPIFLPRRGRDPENARIFFGRVSGETNVYPFSSSTDKLTLAGDAHNPVFELLSKSKFAATEWHVREDANHAKGKTVTREWLEDG